MPKPLPSLNALRAFEAAARHLSFSKAAEELHVTPAAVSHQVKALESDLGAMLFHRLSRGLALTDVALVGLPSLQKAFCSLSRSVELMRGDEQSRVLAVQAPPSFTAKWLVPRLSQFAELHPELELRIAASAQMIDLSGPKVDARDGLREGEIDIAVRFGHGHYSGCRVDRLFGVSAVPLCSPALLTGSKPLRTPSDLRGHTLLHDDTSYEDHPNWGAWLATAGVDDIDSKRGLHFNATSLALQAAAEGQGVALCVDALALDDIAAGRLVIPFDIRASTQSAYYVISLEETADVPRIKAFRTWIQHLADDFRAHWPEPAQALDGGEQ